MTAAHSAASISTTFGVLVKILIIFPFTSKEPQMTAFGSIIERAFAKKVWKNKLLSKNS